MEKLLLAAGFTISLHLLVNTSTPSTSQPNLYFQPQETANTTADLTERSADQGSFSGF